MQMASSSSPHTISRRRQRRRFAADSGGGRDDRAKLPPGWDEQRIKDVLAHYEGQSDDEQFAEIEAALESENTTLIAVPNDRVPEVRALLAREQDA